MAEANVREQRRRIREMRDEELGLELKELRERLFTLRSQAVTEKVEDSSRFGKTRRAIARVLTEQARRRAAGAAPGTGS